MAKCSLVGRGADEKYLLSEYGVSARLSIVNIGTLFFVWVVSYPNSSPLASNVKSWPIAFDTERETYLATPSNAGLSALSRTSLVKST